MLIGSGTKMIDCLKILPACATYIVFVHVHGIYADVGSFG